MGLASGDRFTKGPASAVARLNRIIDELEKVAHISGDGIIEVRRTGHAATISLNVNQLLPRIPTYGGIGGSGTAEVQYGRIIETLEYASPPDYPGRSYYTIRRLGTSLTVWAVDVDQEVGDIVVYPAENNPSYQCKVAHKTSYDILPTNTAYWEQLEDIRVEYALGFETPPVDLRDCIPPYPAYAVVQLLTRTVGSVPRYYIPGIFYTGDPEQSTLRPYLGTEVKARAVFM